MGTIWPSIGRFRPNHGQNCQATTDEQRATSPNIAQFRPSLPSPHVGNTRNMRRWGDHAEVLGRFRRVCPGTRVASSARPQVGNQRRGFKQPSVLAHGGGYAMRRDPNECKRQIEATRRSQSQVPYNGLYERGAVMYERCTLLHERCTLLYSAVRTMCSVVRTLYCAVQAQNPAVHTREHCTPLYERCPVLHERCTTPYDRCIFDYERCTVQNESCPLSAV